LTSQVSPTRSGYHEAPPSAFRTARAHRARSHGYARRRREDTLGFECVFVGLRPIRPFRIGRRSFVRRGTRGAAPPLHAGGRARRRAIEAGPSRSADVVARSPRSPGAPCARGLTGTPNTKRRCRSFSPISICSSGSMIRLDTAWAIGSSRKSVTRSPTAVAARTCPFAGVRRIPRAAPEHVDRARHHSGRAHPSFGTGPGASRPAARHHLLWRRGAQLRGRHPR
jgi:hypothetical protein